MQQVIDAFSQFEVDELKGVLGHLVQRVEHLESGVVGTGHFHMAKGNEGAWGQENHSSIQAYWVEILTNIPQYGSGNSVLVGRYQRQSFDQKCIPSNLGG